ncbi:hypothetical protein BJB45_00890 [Halomonas huangheensis]|uniref:Uncharacterized protein n=1 Tax=Halomonas huangheensis TaxID=1178482 RepID=W1N298_9GAMM|nr:hypothetical protein BJB45_00890 [Halomonas huangheensis]
MAVSKQTFKGQLARFYRQPEGLVDQVLLQLEHQHSGIM